MTDIAALLERLVALEIRAAHQDQTIDDLNEALASHWKHIEALERRLGKLQDELREVEAALEDKQPDAPPPHY